MFLLLFIICCLSFIEYTMSQIKFKVSTSMIISGASKSGKTVWVYNLLKQVPYLFEVPFDRILYAYSIWQPTFDRILETCNNIQFHEGLPTEETLNKFIHDQEYKHILIIIDDLMHTSLNSRTVELLYTQSCHHLNISVINIQQNIFQQGKNARSISLNATVLVLFKNKRDGSQIMNLAKQIAPRQTRGFMDIYNDAVSRQYGYLIIDCEPSHDDLYKFRTNIFKEEEPIIIYELL